MFKSFDPEKVNKVELDLEHMSFLTLNDINIGEQVEEEDLDDTIYKYYDKIFKKIREQTQGETNGLQKVLEDEGCYLNDEFLGNFFEDKTIYNNCKEAYINTRTIEKVFNLYYNLFTFHPKLYYIYGEQLYRIIFKFLMYFDQKEVLSFLKEVCKVGAMLNFYTELHTMISTELDEQVIRELSKLEDYIKNQQQ